ncbi:helix-turn-helix transcriptional regulator [Kitasatospora purpeofusca]|uniref:helix-turn-helix transcriptional regulator n=1 Tax=Kitasatospora purpeofusca TaxID=67352 RepID=UPI0036BAF981
MWESCDPHPIGRQRETDLLDAALARAADGAGGSAVLVRGEPGVGKSTLLERTAREAGERGFTVLRAVGAEAETDFAFGALHQALWAPLSDSRTLTVHQREALEAALGIRAGAAPSGFAVGAAALALLAELSQGGPLLLLLDDLHWIDSSSATVFAFVRRRCAELPLVVVGATRPGGPVAQSWSAEPVEVRALPEPDAALLLHRNHPQLAETTARRVLREAGGNPLAVVELPRPLAAEQQRGVVPLPERLPLGRRLERMFAGRLAAVTPAAGRLLLLAALAAGPDSSGGIWLRAVAGEDAREALEQVEASGLARLDAAGRLVFRHPLVRTAVIWAASPAARREAHRELADCLAPEDPQRLVHEASAALFPDEDLAGRLQEAGSRLARRGGDAEGALLLDRAAALSADADERARRLTWAAVMAARGGQLRYTAALVDELRSRPVPPDIAPLFAYAVVYVDQSHRIDFESAAALLPAALDALTAPGADPFDGLAEQVFFKLLLTATYTDDPRAWQALDRHRAHVSEPARLCHRTWLDPARTARGVARELGAVVDRMSEAQEAGAAWLLLWTASAVDVADGDLWRRFTGLHGYATQGSVAKAKCYQDFLRGRWDRAAVCLREAEAAEELGYHCNALLFRYYHAHFLAGRGDDTGLAAATALIRPVAARAGMRFVLDRLTHLEGLAALAHGRYEEAYTHFTGLTPGGRLPGGLPWFHQLAFDLAEAAAHTGRRGEVRALVAAGSAERPGEISGHHAFLFAAAAALTAEDDTADEAYRVAYRTPGAEQWVFELARLRLAHGSWLRRRHRAEAREVLRAAHRAFRRLQAEPWALRCEEELRAAGGPVAPEPHRVAEALTGQELRIARLAASGLSNKEIGHRLGLSHRTVAAHLYKVFPKLGIASRAALTRALEGH